MFLLLTLYINIIIATINIISWSTLALKAKQSRQSRRSGGTLTQAVKQPYGIYYLTENVFKGIQWGDVNIMKMMQKSISSPPNLAYPIYL